MIKFPSELETLVLCDWSRDEKGLLRAAYPNGAGYMLIRDGIVEYYEVCSGGEYVLVSCLELKTSA